jgi:hypothetical protein
MKKSWQRLGFYEASKRMFGGLMNGAYVYNCVCERTRLIEGVYRRSDPKFNSEILRVIEKNGRIQGKKIKF